MARIVIVESILSRRIINIPWYIIEEIYERKFRDIIKILFPCFFCTLYRNLGAPILQGIDHPIEVSQTKEVGIIKDDINPIAKLSA